MLVNAASLVVTIWLPASGMEGKGTGAGARGAAGRK